MYVARDVEVKSGEERKYGQRAVFVGWWRVELMSVFDDALRFMLVEAFGARSTCIAAASARHHAML
jgi:hypothetical protein